MAKSSSFSARCWCKQRGNEVIKTSGFKGKMQLVLRGPAEWGSHPHREQERAPLEPSELKHPAEPSLLVRGTRIPCGSHKQCCH